MILLIDNYDSFSYNLFQYVGEFEPNVRAIRNDELSVDEIAELNPAGIVISPGPGKPCDAGVCEDVVRRLAPTIPLLGVCLGHQAICEAFGGTVSYAKKLTHGKSSPTKLDLNCPIFKGLDTTIQCARYHSLALVESTLPEELKIVAKTLDDDEVMAVRHKTYLTFGLQFHPESILTPQGKTIVKNFLFDVVGIDENKE